MTLSYDVALESNDVTNDTWIKVRFLDTVRYTSITDSHFSLTSVGSTPSTIPLRSIDIEEDYNSINRTLKLYFSVDLEPNTEYALTITGLVNAAGTTVPTDTLTFTTGNAVIEVTPPTPPAIEVADNTLYPGMFATSSVSGSGINFTSFAVAETDPPNGSVYLESDYNKGRVVVIFTDIPSSNYINNHYFKAERKALMRIPTRWETINARVSHDSSKNEVYVDFPTDDATPVFYPEDGTYFSSNYRYRVRVLKGIAR